MIAVNVLPVVSPPLRTILRVARFLGKKPADTEGIEVVCIQPGASLGSIRDALTWNPAHVRRWMDQGEADAAMSVK